MAMTFCAPYIPCLYLLCLLYLPWLYTLWLYTLWRYTQRLYTLTMASIPTMALHTMAHVSGDDVLSTVHPFPILTMALHTMAHVSRDDVLSTVHLSQVRHQLAAHLVRVRVRVGVRLHLSQVRHQLAAHLACAWWMNGGCMVDARHMQGIRMAYAWHTHGYAHSIRMVYAIHGY